MRVKEHCLEVGKTKWIKILKKYMKELDINITEINTLTKNNIIEKVNKSLPMGDWIKVDNYIFKL